MISQFNGLLDQVIKLGANQRLGDNGIHPRSKAARLFVLRGIGGQRDDGTARQPCFGLIGADGAGGIIARHFGHRDIHQHQIRRRLAIGRDRLFAVQRFDNRADAAL